MSGEAHYRKADVECPFYKRDDKTKLVCEGVRTDVNIQQNFPRREDMEAYMRDFCLSGCWRGCMIAALAREKYE